ncbi:hypothetical protein DOY81_015284, partial [Sarcophaga bullata]
MESKYTLPSKSPLKTFGTNIRSGIIPLKRKLQNSGAENGNGKLFKLSNTNGQSPANSKPNGIQQQTTQTASKFIPSKIQLEQQRQALPVTNCRKRLIQEVHKNDILLIMGETGSGKTTQIPQFLLSAGFGNKGMIAITQPRRVAAITVAKRVAQEQHCQLGELVGYTVRFEDCTSQKTRIRFMTDGFLLREALADRLLRNYTVIMLDEAHERTLLFTSATMDIDHFGRYFGVKGMYLEGRTHPVKVMHAKESQPDYLHATLVTLFDIHRNTPSNHDVLIFLTGQEEIEAMAQQIRQIAKVRRKNSVC